MIIKIDFVTNSSSTAHVVYIPDKFPITTKKIMDTFRNLEKWHEDQNYTQEEVIEYFNVGMNQLKHKDYLNRYDNEEEIPNIIYSTIVEVLEQEGLVIKSIESGVSGADMIVPVSDKKIKQLLNTQTLYGGEE